MTKVSIITATLNSEATIKHNIISVNRQKYKNIEHIIIDGLSNDRTLEVIRKYKNLKMLPKLSKKLPDETFI
jgi:glycosyltransferase involved in cell wall biosynthesis